MGLLSTIDLAADVESGEISIREAIQNHLAFNFRPPVPSQWVEPVCEIIKNSSHYTGEEVVENPVRAGQFKLVTDVIEELHLAPFIGSES